MIASEYIWKNLTKHETVAAEIYVTEMQAEGVRTCNDGFPDTRSPLTNPYEIRIKIAALRQSYNRAYPHVMYTYNSNKLKESYNKGYNKALDDVKPSSPKGFITRISVVSRIENLRALLNKNKP